MASDREIVLGAFYESDQKLGENRVRCPLCFDRAGKDDRRASMAINGTTGKYYCHKCQAKGRVDLGDEFFIRPTPPKQDDVEPPPEDFVRLGVEPYFSDFFYQRPIKYLRKRGLSDETIRDAHLGCSVSMKRVIAPILDRNEEKWLGWQGRSWQKNPFLKYKNAKNIPRRTTVYNSKAIFEDTDRPLLIVEGPFDALPYWPDAVALLGKPSQGQIDLILNTSRPIVVCLDGDAWREGKCLSQRLLLRGARSSFVKLPPKMDPNDVPSAWLRKKAEQAVKEMK